MDIKQRMKLIRMAEKIKENPGFSKKIGVMDKSCFRAEQKKEEEMRA